MQDIEEIKEEKEMDTQMRVGASVARFADGDDWRHVKQMLAKKLTGLVDITNIDVKADNLREDIVARQLAADILLEWLSEVEGVAKQHSTNVNILQETQEEEIIKIMQ